jgi:hypothetical protein
MAEEFASCYGVNLAVAGFGGFGFGGFGFGVLGLEVLGLEF